MKFASVAITTCPPVPSPHVEMDIIFAFEANVGSSNLSGGTTTNFQ